MATARSLVLLFALAGCGGGSNADTVGVGAECNASRPCPSWTTDGGTAPLACLVFKGGYCGLQGCTASAGCPAGSICVHHTDGVNYCFRSCTDKPECNVNRTPVNESNCSSNFDWAVPAEKNGSKACIPPS
jgi:hypothetical protein